MLLRDEEREIRVGRGWGRVRLTAGCARSFLPHLGGDLTCRLDSCNSREEMLTSIFGAQHGQPRSLSRYSFRKAWRKRRAEVDAYGLLCGEVYESIQDPIQRKEDV